MLVFVCPIHQQLDWAASWTNFFSPVCLWIDSKGVVQLHLARWANFRCAFLPVRYIQGSKAEPLGKADAHAFSQEHPRGSAGQRASRGELYPSQYVFLGSVSKGNISRYMQSPVV